MRAPALTADHRQPRLVHVASIPLAPPRLEGLRRGWRVLWLAGDGAWLLQRRHRCRVDVGFGRGRFAPCGWECPDWEDVATAANAAELDQRCHQENALAA